MIKRIDLHYPRVAIESRTEDEPTAVRIGLEDVRAADDIVIDYDFDRDGYRIRMPTVHEWTCSGPGDEGLVEVAFVKAWAVRPTGARP